FLKRMKGLERSTFCMARVGERSRPFAWVRQNLLFAAPSGQAIERQRTRANAECSHWSHCDPCHVQLARPPGSLTHHARTRERPTRTNIGASPAPIQACARAGISWWL